MELFAWLFRLFINRFYLSNSLESTIWIELACMRIFLIVFEGSLCKFLLTLMPIKCDCRSSCGYGRVFVFDLGWRSRFTCLAWFSLRNAAYDLIELCSFICLSAIRADLVLMVISFCAIKAMRRSNFLTASWPICQCFESQWDLRVVNDFLIIKHTHTFIVSWTGN